MQLTANRKTVVVLPVLLLNKEGTKGLRPRQSDISASWGYDVMLAFPADIFAIKIKQHATPQVCEIKQQNDKIKNT